MLKENVQRKLIFNLNSFVLMSGLEIINNSVAKILSLLSIFAQDVDAGKYTEHIWVFFCHTMLLILNLLTSEQQE